jgi:hypothetical protein
VILLELNNRKYERYLSIVSSSVFDQVKLKMFNSTQFC